MSIQLNALRVQPEGPIQVIAAGYRARPKAALIRAAGLAGSIYTVRWRSGDWSDAIESITATRQCFGQGDRPASARAAGAGLKLVGRGVAQFQNRHRIATLDGRALAEQLLSLAVEPGRPIRLVGHSLGTVLIHSALRHLRVAGASRIDSVTLMGSAAPRAGWHVLSPTFTGRLVNLYSPRDYVLKVAPLPHALAGTGEIAADGLADRVHNVNLANRLPHPMAGWRHHCGYWRLMAGLVE